MRLYNNKNEEIGEIELDFPYTDCVDFIQHKINIGTTIINFPLTAYGIEGPFRVDMLTDQLTVNNKESKEEVVSGEFISNDVAVMSHDGEDILDDFSGATFLEVTPDGSYTPSSEFASILEEKGYTGHKLLVKGTNRVLLPACEYSF